MTEKNIKICGVKTASAAQFCIELGATHIGIVFFPKSPRNLSIPKAKEVYKAVAGKAKTVIVTVNPELEKLDEIFAAFTPDFVQLHGDESPSRVEEIKMKYNTKIIKAISVSEKSDLFLADRYTNIADYILFDAKPPSNSTLPGGNAISFDWKIMAGFKPKYKWILSGGLNPENISKALKDTEAYFVDVSSGVESGPGIKNKLLVSNFISVCSHIWG